MSSIAIVACLALLLLGMFPLRAISVPHLPAGPPASASTQTPGVQVAGAKREVLRGTVEDDTQIQDRSPPPHRKILQGMNKAVGREDSIYCHSLLVGSSPPTCQGKCGSCIPCNPIHVSISSPHGALTQQEYYPEVWRCKCGNRLFMP
ncbi:uncharacterized protein [Physcomitrium patens]|uniref:uncharacterized protein n=1 Tax=Physcomitrium patens TaxID=3218 RepID=UPI003CCE0F6D